MLADPDYTAARDPAVVALVDNIWHTLPARKKHQVRARKELVHPRDTLMCWTPSMVNRVAQSRAWSGRQGAAHGQSRALLRKRFAGAEVIGQSFSEAGWRYDRRICICSRVAKVCVWRFRWDGAEELRLRAWLDRLLDVIGVS